MRVRASFLAAVFTCVAAVATLHADWIGVAATATIDEGDLGKVVLNSDGSAGIRPTISSTSAKLRLQVPETPSLLYPDPKPDETRPFTFVMRFRDNGPDARVIATLRRVTLGWFGGPQRSDVAATIDSDRYREPPSGDNWVVMDAQNSYSRSCCWLRDPGQGSPRGMDFFDAGWFVEVQLIKNSAEGNPGVMSVGVIRDQI